MGYCTLCSGADLIVPRKEYTVNSLQKKTSFAPCKEHASLKPEKARKDVRQSI